MVQLRANWKWPLLVMVGDWHVATISVARSRSALCWLPFIIRFVIRHICL
jgi:hypothetical protein